MNFQQLRAFLFEDNAIEVAQKLDGHNINDQNLPFDQVDVPKMPGEHFFREGNIFINKHHRYSEMPAHTHEFVEFNYMFSGNCTQYVDDKEIYLQEGELILLDRETIQRIDPLAKNDILINILLREESITTDVVANMVKSNGLVNEFLLNASRSGSNHNNFIHFHCGDNQDVQQLLHKMVLEYYNKENYYMRGINLILSLLLIELTRDLEKENRQQSQENQELINILQYIDSNYKTLTLDSLASQFGYNSNYLSNKLKKETGRSFQGLINSLRYKAALELMEETDKTFEEISYEIGFETVPSLYKLFAKFSDLTPKELRESILKK